MSTKLERLRIACEANGLPTDGSKAVLLERLTTGKTKEKKQKSTDKAAKNDGLLALAKTISKSKGLKIAWDKRKTPVTPQDIADLFMQKKRPTAIKLNHLPSVRGMGGCFANAIFKRRRKLLSHVSTRRQRVEELQTR